MQPPDRGMCKVKLESYFFCSLDNKCSTIRVCKAYEGCVCEWESEWVCVSNASYAFFSQSFTCLVQSCEIIITHHGFAELETSDFWSQTSFHQIWVQQQLKSFHGRTEKVWLFWHKYSNSIMESEGFQWFDSGVDTISTWRGQTKP